jgi:iron complex transport system substrate-binding protein
MRKITIGLVAVSIVIAAVLAGWWMNIPRSSELVDDVGRSIVLEEPPKKIVSMAPSVTEILFAIGVGEKVVGVTDACDYPPEALEIEKIRESFGDFKIEKIVELNPDLVVMDRYLDLSPPGLWVSKLEETNLKVIVLYAKSFDDVLNDIELIGQATGAHENATRLVTTLETRIEAVAKEVANLSESDKPRVFSSGWYDGESDPWTSGYGTFAHDIIELAGGKNIAGVKGGFFQMSLEAVLWANPQIILIVEDATWPTPTYNALLNDDRFDSTDAMQTNALYKVDASIMSRPGPRLVEALEEVANILHPELFQ